MHTLLHQQAMFYVHIQRVLGCNLPMKHQYSKSSFVQYTLINSKCARSYLYFYVHSTGIKDSWRNKITYHLPAHMGGCDHCAVYFIVCNALYTHTLYISFYFLNIACIKIAFHKSPFLLGTSYSPAALYKQTFTVTSSKYRK